MLLGKYEYREDKVIIDYHWFSNNYPTIVTLNLKYYTSYRLKMLSSNLK